MMCVTPSASRRKTVGAERMRQAVVELGFELGGAGVTELRERLAGEAFEEKVFVVLEVNDETRVRCRARVRRRYGGERGALVGEGELPHAFARRPGVDQVGGAAVGKEIGPRERFVVGGGDEQRVGDVLQRLLALRHGHHAGVAGGGKRVRESADVIEAVGGEVAVVDEEDVHAREVRDNTKTQRRTGE
jgi:hypothetical protein